MADAGLAEIRAIYAERGDQYADTMEDTRWLTMLAVAKAMGITLTNDQARCLAIAGLCDIKYWRALGGFKRDNLVDGGAYNAYLLGELAEQKIGEK